MQVYLDLLVVLVGFADFLPYEFLLGRFEELDCLGERLELDCLDC